MLEEVLVDELAARGRGGHVQVLELVAGVELAVRHHRRLKTQVDREQGAGERGERARSGHGSSATSAPARKTKSEWSGGRSASMRSPSITSKNSRTCEPAG